MENSFLLYVKQEVDSNKKNIKDILKNTPDDILDKYNIDDLSENVLLMFDDLEMAWNIIYYMALRLCKLGEVNDEDIEDVTEQEIAYAINEINKRMN
jgi:hypothetical protein